MLTIFGIKRLHKNHDKIKKLTLFVPYMTEQSFIIDISDLRAFHGVNGSHLELIKSYFPKLKLVFRGDTVKAMGTPEEIQRFSDALEIITSYYEKYHKLDQDILREILNAGAGKS